MDLEVLCLNAKNGDKAAEAMIISQLSPMIERLCAPFFVKGAEKEDILQIAKFALFEAIKGYDPSRKVGFEVYAKICIKNRVVSEVRGSLRKKHRPLNEYVSLSGLDDSDIWAIVSSPEEIVLLDDAVAAFFERTKAILSPFEQEVLKSYYYYENYEATAQALNVSKKSVDNAMCRIRKKLGENEEKTEE